MLTQQKEKIVSEMSDKFAKANSIFLADFTGIDVNTINQLRRKFQEVNVEYRILKNTLAKISFKKAGIGGFEDYLSGVNSYAISYEDPTLPIKVVDGFKKSLNGKFKMKAGYFEGEIIGPEKIEAIASLPSREQLISQVLGTLQAPISKFVGTLQANLTKFIGLLQALEEKNKEQN